MANELIIISPDGEKALMQERAKVAKETALSSAALVGVVKDAATQETAINALREVKRVLLDVEKARKAVKQPVLDLCAAIDNSARGFTAELKEEEVRLNSLIGDFQQEQLAQAREQERKRQEELDRIERQRQEEEYQSRRAAELAEQQRRETEARAEAERKRKEEEASAAARAAEAARGKKAKEAAEAVAAQAKRNAEEAARTEQEQRDRIERERQEAQKQREEEAQKISARAEQEREQIGGPVVPIQAKGQNSKPTYDFEVIDIWKLTRSNPGFVSPQPLRKEILAAINEHGVTQIPGLRIFEVVKTTVNTRQRVIDVKTV